MIFLRPTESHYRGAAAAVPCGGARTCRCFETARWDWSERNALAALGQDEVEDGLTVHSGTLGGERDPGRGEAGPEPSRENF